MPYPELMLKPMRDELAAAGFEELRTADQVDEFMPEVNEGENGKEERSEEVDRETGEPVVEIRPLGAEAPSR